jgi:hypothetical protein
MSFMKLSGNDLSEAMRQMILSVAQAAQTKIGLQLFQNHLPFRLNGS